MRGLCSYARPAVPRIYLSPPHLSGRELELLEEAVDSNWVAPLGPQVDAFERELAEVAGVPYALALSSGTAALHLALVVLGIGAGDEVACSSLTFSASANPIVYVGATPGLRRRRRRHLDDRPGPARRATLGERPAGHAPSSRSTSTASAATTTRSTQICERRGVMLVQDAAESLGASYRDAPAGGQGDLAAFSFNGNKVITTSGGGMLVSRDEGWSSTRASSRRRRASRRRTTSTRSSGSTTG